jgi:hypothetical protein
LISIIPENKLAYFYRIAIETINAQSARTASNRTRGICFTEAKEIGAREGGTRGPGVSGLVPGIGTHRPRVQ